MAIEGESQERDYEIDAFIRADRVAEDLKINPFSEIEYNREEFDELDEGETFVNSVTDFGTNLLAVWSISSFEAYTERGQHPTSELGRVVHAQRDVQAKSRLPAQRRRQCQ